MSALAILVACAVGFWVVRSLVRPRSPDNRAAHLERHRFTQATVTAAPEGPIEITGRVLPAAHLLRAPLSGRPCVYYQVVLSGLWSLGGEARVPGASQEFQIDDGTGRALVRVPPPGPEPTPGDRPETEVLCSLPGTHTSRTRPPGSAGEEAVRASAAVEGIISEGDTITVAGYASLEVTAQGTTDLYRGPPARLMITSARQYPLLIIKS